MGAGRKKDSLSDKIMTGKTAEIIELPAPAKLEGADMPPVKDFLKAPQSNGEKLCAEEIYLETWQWLRERGCDALIPSLTVQEYAMVAARWIQCEDCISKYGLLAEHPTTKAPIGTPYAALSRDYMKQANTIWFSIFQVVKENCAASYTGNTPHEDVMERLLKERS